MQGKSPKDIAQQPTQPMVVERPDRAASPMPVKPDKRLRLRLTVLLSVILLVGLLLGDAFTQRVAIGNWLSHTFTHTAPSSPVVHVHVAPPSSSQDRKSTRLNSSHQIISYAVFCLKKKNN